MLKPLILAAVLTGAAILPAAAQDFDPRFTGPQSRGGWEQNADGFQPARNGFEQPRGEFRGPGRYDALSPRQLARSLRHQGYFDIDILNRRGPVTIVRAAARGRDVILVVDSRSGEVLRARPAGRNWNNDRGWHGGWGNDWRRW